MVAAGGLLRDGIPIRETQVDANDRVLVANTTKGTNTQAALKRRIARARELLARPK